MNKKTSNLVYYSDIKLNKHRRALGQSIQFSKHIELTMEDLVEKVHEILDNRFRESFQQKRLWIIQLRTHDLITSLLAEAMMQELKDWEKTCTRDRNFNTKIIPLHTKANFEPARIKPLAKS